MKIDKKLMESDLSDVMLPMFKGLSEKSASKMIKSIEEKAKNLVKRFYKLQQRDNEYCRMMEKKILKNNKKEIEIAERKAKIEKILATEKPVSLLALPDNIKPVLKKASKTKVKQV